MEWDFAKTYSESRAGSQGGEFIVMAAWHARKMLESTNRLTASASEFKGRFSKIKCTDPNQGNRLIDVNDIELRVYVFTNTFVSLLTSERNCRGKRFGDDESPGTPCMILELLKDPTDKRIHALTEI